MEDKKIENIELISDDELTKLVDEIIASYEQTDITEETEEEEQTEQPKTDKDDSIEKSDAESDPKSCDKNCDGSCASEDTASEESASEAKEEEEKVEKSEEVKVETKEDDTEDKKEEDPIVNQINALQESINSIATVVNELQKNQKPAEEETLKKAEENNSIEDLKKSYDEKFEKAVEVIDVIKKENDKLKAAQQQLDNNYKELQQELSKPARRRESISNLQVIEKATNEQSSPMTKAQILRKLEDLRKANKVSGDEVIAYNVSNILSTNCKNYLFDRKE